MSCSKRTYTRIIEKHTVITERQDNEREKKKKCIVRLVSTMEAKVWIVVEIKTI